MKRSPFLSALSLAAVVVLAGCGSQTGPASDAPNPAEAGTTENGVSAQHNAADVMFAQMMIPHHQQAVEMSELMLEKEGISPEVSELATRIKDAQAPEIESMKSWLEAWGEPVEPSMEGHNMEGHNMDGMDGMDGMMSEDQMAELEAAEGDEATRIFLESMTGHHNGAVAMAEGQIANGENPEAIALAEDIVETQQAEIQEMDELLSAL